MENERTKRNERKKIDLVAFGESTSQRANNTVQKPMPKKNEVKKAEESGKKLWGEQKKV